jgi:hypothetical protein
MTTNYQKPTAYQLPFVLTTIQTGKLDSAYATYQMNKWAKEVPELANLRELVLAELARRKASE